MVAPEINCAGKREMNHELKTWPEPFSAMWEGSKLHEVRHVDRPFEVGDVLLLREWDKHNQYSGRQMIVVVTYITRAGQFGLSENICVMSVRVQTRINASGATL